MIFAPLCVIAVFVASNELLAELTSRPRTRAASVAIMPVTTFTVSLEVIAQMMLRQQTAEQQAKQSSAEDAPGAD